MFSVIIPLYNKAAYVANAIRSVISQSYQEWELIVINDGSTDDSRAVAEHAGSHLGSRFRIVDQENAGVSVARNNGVKTAGFEFIAFLDADDWWDKDYLLTIRKMIMRYPDAGIYSTSYFQVKHGKNRIAPIGVDNTFEEGPVDYCKVYSKTLCMPVWTGATVIRRELFESAGGFKPNLKLGEDFDLWIRIALTHQVVFHNRPLAYYNQDVDLKTRAVGRLHKPEHHILFHLGFLSEAEQTNRDLKQLLDNLRVYGLYEYYLRGLYKNEVAAELKKTDWSRQPAKVRLQYKRPLWLSRLCDLYKRTGSVIKQTVLRISSGK
jgi:glycosyltransferase involved in cell wall biosynthesis